MSRPEQLAPFEPDVLTSSQWLDRRRGPSRPERALWAVVFEDAIETLERRSMARREAWREAVEWVLSEEWHVGSFCWVCQLFGFDHDAVRRALQKRRLVPAPPMRGTA